MNKKWLYYIIKWLAEGNILDPSIHFALLALFKGVAMDFFQIVNNAVQLPLDTYF